MTSSSQPFSWAIGNRHIWTHVCEHIAANANTTSKLTSQSCLFVLGASGIGKTYHVQRLLECHEVYSVHPANCANHKEFRDMLIKGCNPYLVTRTDRDKPYAVLIDDMDVLCSMDRMIMATLLDVLANKSSPPLCHVPIICIGTLDLEKKVSNAKGKCAILKCTAPTDADIFMFLKAHPHGAKKTKKLLMKIAEDCHGNLNRALQAIGSTSKTYTQSTNSESSRIHDMQQHMADDPWMMPLRYHENLPKWIAASAKPKQKLSIYQNILPYFCMWDRMMHHPEIESDMAVDVLAHAICIHTPVASSRKEKAGTGNLPVLEDFTKLLSNLSLQKKHERSMFPSWDHGFPWPHAQIFCEYIKQKWIT